MRGGTIDGSTAEILSQRNTGGRIGSLFHRQLVSGAKALHYESGRLDSELRSGLPIAG